jgi:hypothetical protein
MSTNMKNKFLLLMIIFFLPCLLFAGEEKISLLEELYIKSGMEKQYTDISAVLKEGFDQGLKSDTDANKMPLSVSLAIRDSIDTSFSSELVKADILESFKIRLSDKEIKRILKWLDSSTGRKCTELEEAGSTPGNLEKRMEFEKNLKNNPIPETRVKLIRKLNKATNGTEAAVSIAEGMQIALMTAVNLSMPEEKRMPYPMMKNEIEERKPMIRAILEPEVITGFIYTYRTLTDSELEEYIDFLSSGVGRKYSSASVEGLKKSLENGSMKWGRAIAEILNNAEKHTDI